MQIIYFQCQVCHLPFMTLKSSGFNFFAEIMGGNYAFCCLSCISYNPTSHLKQKGMKCLLINYYSFRQCD